MSNEYIPSNVDKYFGKGSSKKNHRHPAQIQTVGIVESRSPPVV